MNKERQGEFFVLSSAFLWGLFPVITVLSLNHVLPLSSLAWSTLFSTIFFAIILTVRKKWKEPISTSALRDILWVTFIYSILYYVLFFVGLEYTSAGNASIIDLTAVFFSFLLFQAWRKEYISREHIMGAVLVLIAAVIVLYPNLTEFKIGDIMILAANSVVPLGDFFQQRARRELSGEAIMFARDLISLPFLFFIAYMWSQSGITFGVKDSIIFLMINGFILLGCSKMLWIESIHRISITKVHALTSVSPIITLLFAWLLLRDLPTIWQLLSVIPMIAGVILLGITLNYKTPQSHFSTSTPNNLKFS